MSDASHVEREQSEAQAARLRQLLVWTIALCVICLLLELALGLALNSPALLSLSAVVSGVAVLMGVALVLVRRGLLRTAATTIAGASLAAGLMLVSLLPATLAGMMLVPLLVVALMLPYLAGRAIVVLSVVCLLDALVTLLLGTLLPPLLPQLAPQWALLISIISVIATGTLTLLLLWQFSSRLQTSLRQTQRANAELEQARAGLEHQVVVRTADLRSALSEVEARAATQAQLLEENRAQREVIREMSVPILPLGADTIVVPLVGALDSQRLLTIQEQTLGAIEQAGVRYVLLDITGVAVVDTHVAQGLLGVVRAAYLLGAEVVLVGVRPEVAQAVVGLGLDLSAVPTCRSLQEGLAYTRKGLPSRQP